MVQIFLSNIFYFCLKNESIKSKYLIPVSAPKLRRVGIPYRARTCAGGGPGGGPGGFFPGGKRGTPGTAAKTGPEDDDRGPLLRVVRMEKLIL